MTTSPGSTQCEACLIYNASRSFTGSMSAILCNLSPGFRCLALPGRNGAHLLQNLSHDSGGTTRIAPASADLADDGSQPTASQIRLLQTWRLYPPKSSSPPSP